MSEIGRDQSGNEAPTLEIRIYHHGHLLTRDLCESEEQAAAIAASWEEVDGIECEVSDLSATAHDETDFEIEPIDTDDDFRYWPGTAKPS